MASTFTSQKSHAAPRVDTSRSIHTPQRTPSPTPNSVFKSQHQSPFSDYFTDPDRDCEADHDAGVDHDFEYHDVSSSVDLPSLAQRQALRRLDSIRDQILRKEASSTAFPSVLNGLENLEAVVGAVDAQSRIPAHGGDSGLFPDDDSADGGDNEAEAGYGDDDDLDATELGGGRNTEERETLLDRVCVRTQQLEDVFLNRHDYEDGSESLAMDSISNFGYAELKSELSSEDRYAKIPIKDLEVVDRITNSAAQLRERFEEVKQSNGHLSHLLSNATTSLLSLRSENDTLRTTLAFTQSEMLYLKLQLRGLEAQVAPFFGGGDPVHLSEPELTLQTGIERWEHDWNDVDTRFKAKRDALERCRMTSDTPPEESIEMVLNSGELAKRFGRGERGEKNAVGVVRPGCHMRSATAPGNVDLDVIALKSTSRTTPAGGYEEVSGLGSEEVESELGFESAKEGEREEGLEITNDDVNRADVSISDEEEKEEEEPHDTDVAPPEETFLFEEQEETEEASKSPTQRQPKTKTPWQDLWSSLAAFAGMDLSDDEDEPE